MEQLLNADDRTNTAARSLLNMTANLTKAAVALETILAGPDAAPEDLSDALLAAMIAGITSFAAAGASTRGKLFDADEFAEFARRIAGETAAMQEEVEADVAAAKATAS
jgi:hypothetical protein